MKNKHLEIPLMIMLMISTIPLILNVTPAEASPTGPSLIVNDSLNQLHATLGSTMASAVTVKGTVTNHAAPPPGPGGWLTGVFYRENGGPGIIPLDLTLLWSMDGSTWWPAGPIWSPTNYPGYDLELIVGGGGYYIPVGMSSTTYIKTIANRNINPADVEVIVFEDINANSKYDVGESIHSTGDMPVEVTLGIWNTAELDPAIFYDTIQAAINAAAAGDTIYVYDGMYNEALYINKNLIIIAASTPIIQGGQMRATNYGNRMATIFVEDANDVTLQDLDVEGQALTGKSYAVLYENSGGTVSGCTLSPNTIGDMNGAGIAAWDNSVLTVRGCMIQNFGRIGAYANNATVTIENNTIIGQVYSLDNQVNYGIEIEDYSGPSIAEITQNVIFNCNNTHPAPMWSSAAIIVDTWREWADYYNLALLPSRVSIAYNTIYDNYEAIEIVSNDLSSAHNNHFYHNTWGVWSAPENWSTNPTYYVFDAIDNWWGDDTGPHHETSWLYMGNPYGPHLGNGDIVGDYVLYDPWLGKAVDAALMKVDPPHYMAKDYNETFSLNVTLFNVTETMSLVGVEFKLEYNTTMLQVIGVTEGPFLNASAGPPHQGTFFGYFVGAGYVQVYVLIMPDENGIYHSFPSGNGTIATITFRAIYQSMNVTAPPDSCNLRLFETLLVDKTGTEPGIPHGVEGGVYEIIRTCIGDLNYDGTVNILDIVVAAISFGSTPSDPNWNSRADLNGDHKINIIDIVVIAIHYGETKPDP